MCFEGDGLQQTVSRREQQFRSFQVSAVSIFFHDHTNTVTHTHTQTCTHLHTYTHTHTHTRCYTCSALAQIGLGSPALFYSIPLHLRQRILALMSSLLETVPPADLRHYEEKMKAVWGTFLPFIQFLYEPATMKGLECSNRESYEKRHNVHIICCNVLLHELENTLGRQHHLEILVKEGLLDYTMCLPAVLPGECQPRARSLVNELGKHRQLQPPSLCTLAKAHIAKTFCGLQPVMEMNSIGEFLHNFHN